MHRWIDSSRVTKTQEGLGAKDITASKNTSIMTFLYLACGYCLRHVFCQITSANLALCGKHIVKYVWCII